MHKWAIKQFMRIVPHGRMLGQHLASKHYAQLLCTAPPPEEAPILRFCHCSAGPAHCTHSMHVHVAMPGLREQANGQYERVARSEGRYILKIPMGEFKYQDALRRYIGELTGVYYKNVTLPEEVFQAKTMELSWHNQKGKLQVCPTSVGIFIIILFHYSRQGWNLWGIFHFST